MRSSGNEEKRTASPDTEGWLVLTGEKEQGMLPEQFTDRMREMLGQEYPAFAESYENVNYQSLRINHLKDVHEELKNKVDFLEDKVVWADGGYYYRQGARPGKHPLHEAGVYYIQEASAMAPVGVLEPKPGERILDLCAAPGGKSTQIGAAMQGQGLLVCNEIHPKRAGILSENIERMGITNALVVSHEPAVLAEHFPGFFDRILVDAPCSGEGMFRKKEEAVSEWSPENVRMCVARQREILGYAAVMLRPGGRLVYSTCTFAPAENEGTIGSFLAEHEEFHLEEIRAYPGMEPGRPEYLEKEPEGKELSEKVKGELIKTCRLWPHRLKGEGHFMACLQKEGTGAGKSIPAGGIQKGIADRECTEWLEFQKQYLKRRLSGVYLKFGEQLYLVPEDTPALKGLKVLRAGLHLGTIKKDRFEPSHALALVLGREDVVYACDRTLEEAAAYQLGNTFYAEGEKGWYLIVAEGYSIGWGKLAGGVMKNHYPKGLRK